MEIAMARIKILNSFIAISLLLCSIISKQAAANPVIGHSEGVEPVTVWEHHQPSDYEQWTVVEQNSDPSHVIEEHHQHVSHEEPEYVPMYQVPQEHNVAGVQVPHPQSQVVGHQHVGVHDQQQYHVTEHHQHEAEHNVYGSHVSEQHPHHQHHHVVVEEQSPEAEHQPNEHHHAVDEHHHVIDEQHQHVAVEEQQHNVSVEHVVPEGVHPHDHTHGVVHTDPAHHPEDSPSVRANSWSDGSYPVDDSSPVFEHQNAVWPEGLIDSNDPHESGHDNYHHNNNNNNNHHSNVPVYEEQSVAYPTQSVHRPPYHTTHRPVHIPTWQQVPTKPTVTVPVVQQQQQQHGGSWPQPIAQPPVQGTSIQLPHYEGDLVIYPEFPLAPVHHQPEDHGVDNMDNDDTTSSDPLEGAYVPLLQPDVIENYQILHPNGTGEHKLVLSNGLVNYKKIYMKLLPTTGKLVPVQEGYVSLPINDEHGFPSHYETQYYIADETGYNVYRAEKQAKRPQLPTYLDYKHQDRTQ